MITVILVFHIMVAAALVGVVLLQRSEGGALGIGGGGGGGLMTGRGAANLLTKTTAVLAAVFFSTSIALAILASMNSKPRQIVAPTATEESGKPKAPGGEPSQLPKLNLPAGPQLPQSK